MNETLGNRIRKIRLAKGNTRKILGEQLNFNCPESRIEEYESGKRVPRKAMLSKIAKVLNVSEDYLLTGKMDNETFVNLFVDGVLEKICSDEKEVMFYFLITQLDADKGKMLKHFHEEDFIEIEQYIKDKIENREIEYFLKNKIENSVNKMVNIE